MTIATTVTTLQALLDDERQAQAVRGVADLLDRHARRSTIRRLLQELETTHQALQQQLWRLPPLPPLEIVRWAQTVQAMPNLAFLEVDITGLHDADIIRLLVLTGQGKILLDCYVKPSQPINAQISHITGITQQELDQAGIALDEALARLEQTLHGRYILSYHLDFDQRQLSEAARRAHRPALSLVGECLMQRAMQYDAVSSYPKLEALCQRIGQPLPPQPHQTALDRARGQAELLDAMANVLHQASAPLITRPPVNEDGETDLDDQPF
ncbi:MAG: 3'-5' exonuclease [Ktedonobacteraceae bacterium]|nr:3'-5' exonuclease [Ktedonobacteraceae bacterium]